MEAILLLLVIVLFVQYNSLSKRFRAIESQLGLSKVAATPSAPASRGVPVAATPAVAVPAPPTHPVNATPKASEPLFIERAIEWLKRDTLLKTGAFFLLLGFGWLVTYAFMNNWIGPVGRIALGIIAGLGILIFGFLRISRFPDQGSVFLGLGASVLMLTTYAARFEYGFLTPLTALVFIYLVSLFVSYASYHFRIRSLAFMGLFIGAVSPFLTNSRDDHLGLFAYLFVLVLGTLWLAAVTAWRELTTVAIAVVGLHSLPSLFAKPWDMESLTIFSFIFAAIFFIANILNVLKSKDGDRLAEMGTAFLNATLLLLWIIQGVAEEWQGLITAAWMIVFSGGSFVIYRLSGLQKVFLLYAGISIAYLAAATAMELDGAILTIAFTAEAIAIVLIAHQLTGRLQLSERLSFLLLLPMALSLESMFSSAWRAMIPLDHFSTLLFISLSLSVLGMRFLSLSPDTVKKVALGRVWLYAGTGYFYLLLWLTFHAVMDQDIATMLSLVIYTVIGLGTYIAGKRDGRQGLKLYGVALLVFVIFHLLVIDARQMDLIGRIITFFIVGILLMSTTFVKARKPSVTLTPEP